MSVTLNASTSSGFIQSADTSGTVEIQSNGTTRLTVASGGVTTTGNTSISNLTATGTFGGGVVTSGTAVASTSGTSIDFTGIPSWVKRITVMFNGVSTNAVAASAVIVQLGVSGTPTTSGYTTAVSTLGTSTVSTSAGSTAGFPANQSVSNAAVFTGQMVISNITGNTWVASNNCARTDSATIILSDGSVALSGALNLVRITTTGGTDTFDAGTINILYEG